MKRMKLVPDHSRLSGLFSDRVRPGVRRQEHRQDRERCNNRERDEGPNVVTIGGQITVDGVVDNNVVAVGGSVVLTKEGSRGGQCPLPGRGDRERAGCSGERKPDGDQLLQPLRNPNRGPEHRMGGMVLGICRHFACHLSRYNGRGAPDRGPPAEAGPHIGEAIGRRYLKVILCRLLGSS